MKTALGIASPEPNDIVQVLADSVRDPVLVVEPQSLRILQVNEKAAVLLGYREVEVRSRTLDQIVDARSVDVLREAASHRGTNSLHPARFELNNGETRDV